MPSVLVHGDARQLEEARVSACLTKPIRHGELLRCLTGVLSRAAISEAAEEMPRFSLAGALRPQARVLLVEDNVTNQQVAIGILESLGLRIDAVPDGQQAIRALTDLPYDLVLMDVQMPVMDGLEAARRIRDLESSVRNHEIPIVAMTARAMASDQDECLAAGMNDYVAKPVDPGALLAALARWLPPEVASPRVTLSGPSSGSPVAGVLAEADAAVVYDHAALLGRVMGDEATLRMVRDIFLKDVPRLLESLTGSVSGRDAKSAADMAHTIKGAAANVGGDALCRVAVAMEIAGREGEHGTLVALLPELHRQFHRLRAAMSE